MDLATRAANMATRLINSNTFMNIFLIGSFAALSVRSVNQQKDIEALEAEKVSLIKSNKAMKMVMWDWKQQLFSEASSSPDSAIVPLARLKVIYGEAATVPGSGDAETDVVKSPAAKLVI
ncbi:hypothetical protein Nepgr_023457 [Nepenthes gracilis]|uniref:Uncharacterized protein n=1 Tax=Nepenthes gracilis TaxID=150966 RepID=A0AAD3XZ46_NEPGR|nr:hypothetical protein Nepgr_023457 [Nepenthes gracilis]